MAMRCQPASFSRSRRMVIWKTTDTKQCTTLGRGAHQASAVLPLPAAASQALQGQRGLEARGGCALAREPSSGGLGGGGGQTSQGPGGKGRAARGLLPSVEEQRQPEPVELIWDLGVEEGQQPTHLVQAVHLGASAWRSVPSTQLALTWGGAEPGTCCGRVPAPGGCGALLLTLRAPPGPASPGSRALPLRGNSRA